jgi:hypothetical protein
MNAIPDRAVNDADMFTGTDFPLVFNLADVVMIFEHPVDVVRSPCLALPGGDTIEIQLECDLPR